MISTREKNNMIRLIGGYKLKIILAPLILSISKKKYPKPYLKN